LLDKLKTALDSKRPKNVKEIMEEIDKYDFKEDNSLINKIKEFVKKFKFKEARELL
jgi:isoleucyl-tRNA synthetase